MHEDGIMDARRPRPGKKTALVMATGLSVATIGLLGGGTATAADLSPAPAATTPAGPAAGPADGGATGVVDATSATSFTFTTAMGVEVTATENSATKYEVSILPVTRNAVKKGESVLVLGLVDATGAAEPTITASQVTVQPFGDGGAAAAQRAGVIPFQQGVPSPAKSVGQIPSDYTEGDGTIVDGTVADKATAVGQSVVPGGVVDRVVQLSDGEYEVHNIGTNWPHHVFVNQDFAVVGWE